MSDDTSTKFCIFPLKSVAPLVHWSVVDFEPKKSWVQALNTPEKKKKKSSSTRRSEIRIKIFTDSSRNQQTKLRTGILREILSDRNFGFYKKYTKSHPKFRLSGNRIFFEVSGENELLFKKN
jgi:hypothetical protein